MPAGVTPWRCVEVSLKTARKAPRTVFVSTKPAQPQWIDAEVVVEGNYPLEMSVEIRRAKARAVPCDPLVKSKVKADRLLGAQRRIAKAPESQT